MPCDVNTLLVIRQEHASQWCVKLHGRNSLAENTLNCEGVVRTKYAGVIATAEAVEASGPRH